MGKCACSTKTYEELVAVAFIEGRTVAVSCGWCLSLESKNLTPNDLKVVQAQIRKNKAARDKAKRRARHCRKEELDNIVI